MTPFILWLLILDLFLISSIIIIFVGLTDFLDGYLARKYNFQSIVGLYLDAIADKIFIVTIYLILGVKLLLPSYLIILVIFREVLIFGSYLLNLSLNLKLNYRPILISKINTFFQISLTIFVCLFTLSQINEINGIVFLKESLIALVTVTTIVSSLIYIIIWSKAVKI